MVAGFLFALGVLLLFAIISVIIVRRSVKDKKS